MMAIDIPEPAMARSTTVLLTIDIMELPEITVQRVIHVVRPITTIIPIAITPTIITAIQVVIIQEGRAEMALLDPEALEVEIEAPVEVEAVAEAVDNMWNLLFDLR